MMPLYRVRRSVPDLTAEDIDAAGFRALVCSVDFEGLHWVVSHWDRDAGEIHCIYEALGPEQLIEHARRSRIPCDEVREVSAVRPDDIVQPGNRNAVPVAAPI